MTDFIVGPGIAERMSTDQVNPASDELPISGRRPDVQWAEAVADDGSIYRWVRLTNTVHRYQPGGAGASTSTTAALEDRLQMVVDLGLAQHWKPYSGPVVNEPDAARWGDPGFDCSSFVASMYRGALHVQLTGFTDAIADQTDTIATADALPGDIILYRYNDTHQPGVTYPHTGLWLGQGKMLDCQYPEGLGVHPMLAAPFEIHRARGL